MSDTETTDAVVDNGFNEAVEILSSQLENYINPNINEIKKSVKSFLTAAYGGNSQAMFMLYLIGVKEIVTLDATKWLYGAAICGHEKAEKIVSTLEPDDETRHSVSRWIAGIIK